MWSRRKISNNHLLFYPSHQGLAFLVLRLACCVEEKILERPAHK